MTLELRVATAADGPAVAELERRAPLRLGRDPLTLMTFDHGADFFTPTRLMSEAVVYVAELNGWLCGVYCAALQRVLVAGTPKLLFLEHHCRVDPAAPRAEVFGALSEFGRRSFASRADSVAFYVSVDNEALRRHLGRVSPWSVQPLRVLIRCNSTAVSAARCTTYAREDVAARVLNACHGESELFVPYTPATFAERVRRDPAQYSVADLSCTAGAVVGLSRSLVTVTKECVGEIDRTVRATLFDHGFEPGHERCYRELLERAGALAAARGATHLALFTSEGSPTHDLLVELAESIEVFDFWTFALAEPADVHAGGVYVDPIYF